MTNVRLGVALPLTAAEPHSSYCKASISAALLLPYSSYWLLQSDSRYPLHLQTNKNQHSAYLIARRLNIAHQLISELRGLVPSRVECGDDGWLG